MHGFRYSNKDSIPNAVGEEEKLSETMFLLSEVCKQSSRPSNKSSKNAKNLTFDPPPYISAGIPAETCS